MYTVLIIWSRPVCVTPTGQVLPEVPTTSRELHFDSKRKAWDFIKAKLESATDKCYEVGFTVAMDDKVVFRTDNLEMLPHVA